MVEILKDMDHYYDEIRTAKCDIADKTMEKINARSEAWKEAKDIKLAKEKEDYVKSAVSTIQMEIDKLEADVEYYYGQIKILGHKLEFGDE